jgi:hypothetical protein
MAVVSTCYISRMHRRLAALWVCAACACCSKSEVKNANSGDGPIPPKPTLTIFALAEVRGQIGPCGCTSDPLGDISRTTQLVADARGKGPVLVVDAGSLLYSQNPVPAYLDAQEELKADLLATIYKRELHVDALGLGPADLAKGPSKLRLPRIEANVSTAASAGGSAIQATNVISVGDAKIGVFGVIARDAVKLEVGDPVATAKQAIAKLHNDGAQLVVALVQAPSKKDAIRLLRDIGGGIDIAVAGLGLDAPEPEKVEPTAENVAGAWLVIPANRGQVVSRIDVTLHGPLPLVDAVGPAAAAARGAELDKQLAQLDADLAKFKADPTADPKFVASKQAERTQLAAERERLNSNPIVAPPHASFFTLDQVRINKTLACSIPAQTEVTKFYAAAGDANVKAAAQKPVPEPAKGQASYVGMSSCGDCHSDAVEFWQKTVHHDAWKTLVDRGQQFDFDCIGCHVTAWDKPGGSNLGHNETLRDIQCETCHGPASIHVAKGGEEKPSAVRRAPPEDLCASQCHTHEHSDTFQHDAYMRDIVGPGHGPELRKKLGDGPTGASLRKAALDKAGKNLGAGCTR